MREIASTGRSRAQHNGLERRSTDNLEVVWGALIAAGDRRAADPGRRRDGAAARRRRPARGGAASRRPAASRASAGSRSSSGIFVPALAFLDLDRRDARHPPRRRDRDHRRRGRRLPRPPLVGEARRAGRPRPRSSSGSASGCTASRSRSLGVQTLPKPLGMALTIVGIVAVMNMVNFLDGLDGLAAGVCAISALSFCVIGLSRGDVNAAILTARRPRRLPRLPAPQLLSGPDLHGRLRARSCSASRSPPCRSRACRRPPP